MSNGWQTVKLGDVAFVTKLAGFEFTKYIKYTASGEIIALRALNLKNGKLDLTNIKRISRQVSQGLTRSKLNKGDVLLSYVGSIGEVALIDENDKYHLAPNICKIVPHQADPKFLIYLLLSDSGKSEIRKFLTTTSQPALSMGNVRSLTFNMPPLAEQNRIVQVLETWDEYLENLDKKIAAKKNVKTDLMQQLLTGKKRLPGFNGEWRKDNLGDLLSKLTDYTANGSFAGLKENVKYYSSPEYAVLVRTTDLEKNVFVPQRYTDQRGYEYLKKTSLYGGELIMANVGNIGKVYRVPFYEKPMTLAPNTYLLEFDDKIINKEFIYQKMLMQSFKNQVLKMVGSGGLVAINKANFRKISIDIPNEISEQVAIAEVLGVADREISLLTEQRNHLVAQRKYLLNNLISGKIRVPESITAKEAAHA